MDPDWLNGIGIILNFFAGFMLAPELIGLDRIRASERWLERRLTGAYEFVKRLPDSLSEESTLFPITYTIPVFEIILWTTPIIALVSGAYWYFIFWILPARQHTILNGLLWSLAASFVMVMLAMIGISVTGYWVEKSEKDDAIQNLTLIFFMALLLLSPLVGLGLPLSLLLFIGYLLPKGVERSITWVLHKLEGSDRLRSVLVSFGILFFIAGNLLQFIAILRPPEPIRPPASANGSNRPPTPGTPNDRTKLHLGEWKTLPVLRR